MYATKLLTSSHQTEIHLKEKKLFCSLVERLKVIRFEIRDTISKMKTLALFSTLAAEDVSYLYILIYRQKGRWKELKILTQI